MLPPKSSPLFLPETWSIPLLVASSWRLHASFLLHLLLQLLNAVVRHYQDVHRYVLYIFILHGPVLWCIVAAYAAVQGRVSSAPAQSPVCLTLFGTWGFPATDKETQLGVAGALVFVVLTLIFVILYGLFDKFDFDKTFTDGVDADELKTFSGFLANVFAQATWLCVQLTGVHALLPAYPSSATLILGRCLRSLFMMELYATTVSFFLVMTGVYEFLADDDNGIGVYMLCVYPILLIQSARRLWSASDAEHPLTIWRRQNNSDTTATASARASTLPTISTTTPKDDEAPTASESLEDATETMTEETKPQLV